MSLNAYEITERWNSERYADYAAKREPRPQYLVVQSEPSLRAVFRSSSKEDTGQIGIAASEYFLEELGLSAPLSKRYRLGLIGSSERGKTTFSEAFLHNFLNKSEFERLPRTEITTAFNTKSMGIITHHDAGHKIKDPLAVKYADQPGLEIIEHPQYVENRLFDFLIHFGWEQNSMNNVLSVLAEDEHAQTAHFRNFIQKLEEFRISPV